MTDVQRMYTGHILIIDDETRLRGLYARLLTLEGHTVETVGSASEAFQKLAQADFDLVITDVRLPDADGVELTRKIRSAYPQPEIIVVTAFGNIADGVQAMKNGAYDYLTKGDSDDQIVARVSAAVEKALLRRKVFRLEGRLTKGFMFTDLVGQAPAFLEAVALARKVAPTSAAVLLLGETGVGKELFAQSIHAASTQAKETFVAINCAALPRDMLESELFGYRKGAFTGATADKKGLLEEADGGTLFLDEISEMPLELQAKLLRAIEEGTFLKLGDTKPTHSAFRVISATNRELADMAEQGRFRMDLYYRLAVFVIRLPALAERAEDITLLTRHFIDYYAVRMGRAVPQPSAAFLQRLRAHQWRGNVRELRNVIERALILCEGEVLTEDLLPFADAAMYEVSAGLKLADVERTHILHVLRLTGGNKTKAAEALGVAPSTLYRKLEEYGL